MDPGGWLFGIAIVVATFLGPLIAVLVTRWIDQTRETKTRKLWVFRSLLANRRATLSKEFVDAMNLVEIEFFGNERVIGLWRRVMDKLHTDVSGFKDDERDRHFEEINDLRAKMMHEIGLSLGYKMEQLDILRGGYFPEGWRSLEHRNELINHFLADVALGQRAFPIVAIQPRSEGEQGAKDAFESWLRGERALPIRIVDQPASGARTAIPEITPPPSAEPRA